ncbi:GNAT family N-acetyltransferase [Mesorhizobium amorphae]|uniref:GNAT family N-acetyltransferase n=1 Tax=Mesorhizobium amorphae TaxID=71433 RepID=UPI003F4F4467
MRAAYARWVPVIGREPLPMRADYDKAVREHQFDLAIEKGAIVGLIETMRHDDHLWIENVAVAPEAQGRGIGRLLLDSAERRAVEAGCQELRLLTNGAFETKRLYGGSGRGIHERDSRLYEQTISRLMHAASGQSCNAPLRMFLPRDRHDEAAAHTRTAAEKFTVGPAARPNSTAAALSARPCSPTCLRGFPQRQLEPLSGTDGGI